MAQQIELRNRNGNEDIEQLQRLQQELDQVHLNLQRMTSTEEREDRRKMREVFESVSKFMQMF